MLESLIPGAVWRAIDFAFRRLRGRAWDVRIELRRVKGRARETEQLWKMTRHEVDKMLDKFPALERHEREDETRLSIDIRFTKDEAGASGGRPSGPE